VTYSKQRKSTQETISGEKFGPFVGENTFSFVVTDSSWKVNLSPAKSVVCRHSTKPAKRPTVKVTASLNDADSDKTVLISSSSDGGQVKFGTAANNATNATLTLTIPKTGTVSFYISGEKESTKTNDVILTAKTNDTSSIVVGSTNVTVLWVNLKVNKEGEISKNNSQREVIAQIHNNKLSLGKDIATFKDPNDNKKFHVHFRFVVEAEGSVLPQDFTSDLIIRRDVATVEKNKQTNNYVVISEFNTKLGVITKKQPNTNSYPDDTGSNLFRDDTPPQIYDFDEPGPAFIFEETTTNEIHNIDIETIQYFRILVAYEDEDRCSDIVAYIIENKIDFKINTNINAPEFTIYKHDVDLKINPNNANNENDFYNYPALDPP
jgi:hypothetical protein